MEHDAFMEVIDRLITGGMKEMDALALVARMLQEESEEFISIMKEIEDERDPAKMNQPDKTMLTGEGMATGESAADCAQT